MKNYNLKLMQLILSIICLILFNPIYAQQVLTLEETLSLSLDENIAIKISSNNKKKADNQATMGNAGLLPKINLIGSGSYNEGKASLEFASSDFQSITEAASETSNINGNIEFQYILFNGLGSINTFRKLNIQNDLKSIELKIQIEQTIISSAKQYYDIAYLQEQHAINKKLVEISLERYNRIKIQKEFGNASNLDLLSAEIDLNNDSTGLINTSVELNNAKNVLNQILNRNSENNFRVNQEVKLKKNLNYLELKERVNNNNNNIVLQQYILKIAEKNRKINTSYLMPKIALTGQYGYSNIQSNTSLITEQTNLGASGYINLSWNLFDGFSKKVMLQNAKIEITTNELKLESIKNEINNELENIFNQYINNINLIEIEIRNKYAAEKFFQRSQEQYYQGQLSNNDFRLAQVTLGQSINRLNRINYLTKIAELNLYRISAQIIL